MRVGLVACSKRKLSRPAPARDLYDSPLFRGARSAVEASCERWFVLSAEHGLLRPEQVIAPYDTTLNDASRERRRAWSRDVQVQLREEVGDFDRMTFEVHAGRNYYAFGLVEGLKRGGATVEIPVEGLTLGQRLAFYNRGTRDRGAPSAGRRRSKYSPLREHLEDLKVDHWTTTFTELEAILGSSLPESASKHQAWWSATQPHAAAWLDAGWRLERVDQSARTVAFQRDHRAPAPLQDARVTEPIERAVGGTRPPPLDARLGLLDELYDRLHAAAKRAGGPRRLRDCTGRDGWPPAGVYFLLEPGEYRAETRMLRVVRVGTHALTATSKTSLWTRLRAHRGAAGGANAGGGNHRGSIFRLHVGTALINRGGFDTAAETWGRGSSATRHVRAREVDVERAVSHYIGDMYVIAVEVRDRHDRARLERDCIALLSNYERPPMDPPSEHWLGNDADRPAVRASGLWNVQHVELSAPARPCLDLICGVIPPGRPHP